MSNMYITEFADLGVDGNGNIMPVGSAPPITVQKVAFTSTAGVSAAFNNLTKFVRIYLDGAGYIAFGAAPTAVTATDTPMAATTPEYFGVIGGQKVSAVS